MKEKRRGFDRKEVKNDIDLVEKKRRIPESMSR
jgi:hypothetical protein